MDRPGAVAALRAALGAFAEQFLPQRGGWAVALSGGPDSLALTAVAAAMRPTTALIVDHGLQAGSAQVAKTACRQALDLVVLVGIGVDQQHAQLVSVAAVDQARRVEARHPVAQRQPAAGLHEPGVPVGQGQGDAGGHGGAPAPAPQQDRGPGHEVGPGVAHPGVRGQGQVGVEPDDGDLQHAAIFAGTASPAADDGMRATARGASPGGASASLASCSSGWTSR